MYRAPLSDELAASQREVVRGTLDARRLSQTHTVQPTNFKSTRWVCSKDPTGKEH